MIKGLEHTAAHAAMSEMETRRIDLEMSSHRARPFQSVASRFDEFVKRSLDFAKRRIVPEGAEAPASPQITKMLPRAKGVLTEKVIDSKLRERKASVLWPINFDVKAGCTNIGANSAGAASIAVLGIRPTYSSDELEGLTTTPPLMYTVGDCCA